MKAPRRPTGEVWSVNNVRAAGARDLSGEGRRLRIRSSRISNARNPFAEWRPQVWGWDRIADFRGYAVWAKSPIAGVYRSRRQGETTSGRARACCRAVGAGAARRRS